MVLIEAMSAGTPVVAYDCPTGPAELVTDGVDGLLVRPQSVPGLAEALSRLLADRSSGSVSAAPAGPGSPSSRWTAWPRDGSRCWPGFPAAPTHRQAWAKGQSASRRRRTAPPGSRRRACRTRRAAAGRTTRTRPSRTRRPARRPRQRAHLLRVGRGGHPAVEVLAGERHERAVLPELLGVGERVEGAGHGDHAEQVAPARAGARSAASQRSAPRRNRRPPRPPGTSPDQVNQPPIGPRSSNTSPTSRLVVQEPRDLAVGQALDHQLQQRVVRVGGHGVGALGGVVVRCAEPEHVVLAGQVVDPVGHLEPQPHEPVGALDLASVPVVQAAGRGESIGVVLTGRPGSAAPATGRRGRGSRSAPRTPACRGPSAPAG